MADTFDSKSVVWVFDRSSLNRLIDAIRDCAEVVIDLETTGLDEHATAETYPARIVLASLTLPKSDADENPLTWVVPLSHPDSPWLGKWTRVMLAIAHTIWSNNRPVVNQNVKFDARWIYAHTQIDLSKLIVWDTQSGSHLLDETWTTKLKERVPKIFGIERWDDFDLSTPGAAERVPLFDLGLYAARDTYWTHKLATYQRKIMHLHPTTDDMEPIGSEEVEAYRLGLLATWCAMPTVSTLTAIEQRGLLLDRQWVDATLGQHLTDREAMGAKLSARYAATQTGWTPDYSFAPTSKWFKSWVSEAVQLGDIRTTSYTAKGSPQWSKSVLVKQERAGSPIAGDLLKYRELSKRAEYLQSWIGYATPKSTVHSTYNSARVITGRLSSNSPNVQQVTYALKPGFIPRPGNVIIDLDYSQIELRIAAFISRCPIMIDAFQRGLDLHRLLALRILQLSEDYAASREKRRAMVLTDEDVTPRDRQNAKPANFGLLYMMGAEGFQNYAEDVYGVAFSAHESEMIYNAFYSQWEGVGPWHRRAVNRARATGQVVSPIGRVRRLPDINDRSPYHAAKAERAAVNAPVQGFGSDVMQIAAGLIEGTIRGARPVKGASIVGTVHDSIIVEAPADRWREVTDQCIDRMVNVHWVLEKMGCTLDVPLVVEAKAGSRWGMSDVGTV